MLLRLSQVTVKRILVKRVFFLDGERKETIVHGRTSQRKNNLSIDVFVFCDDFMRRENTARAYFGFR
jgi:hypothetical protein